MVGMDEYHEREKGSGFRVPKPQTLNPKLVLLQMTHAPTGRCKPQPTLPLLVSKRQLTILMPSLTSAAAYLSSNK
jgi:hypothetical protein